MASIHSALACTHKPVLFYAGGEALDRAGQEKLLEYVEAGGHLVSLGAYLRRDEHLQPLNLIGIQEPAGITSGQPFGLDLQIFGRCPVLSSWAYNMELIRFLGKHSFNFYVYAPKMDRHHRLLWREPYPPAAMADFAKTIQTAQEAGVTFCYAISPGESFVYDDPADFRLLTDKLKAFYHLGVRAFSLLLDDIDAAWAQVEEMKVPASLAGAHADLCSRVYTFLDSLDPNCSLSMCPTDYAGVAPFSDYLHTLGERLDPAIQVMYTGPDICCREITREQVLAFSQVIRRPPLIWDNYPVNDGGMAGDLHLGPLRGRDPQLYEVAKGFLANPMLQPEATKIPLATLGDYLTGTATYDPDRSWQAALLEAAQEPASAEALRLFGENSLKSCVSREQSVELARLVPAALEELGHGISPEDGPAAGELEAYLSRLDQAAYHLTYQMENQALRQDLLPWLELLDHRVRAALLALQILKHRARREPYRVQHSRMLESLKFIHKNPRQITGQVLQPLLDWTLEQVSEKPAASQPVQAPSSSV